MNENLGDKLDILIKLTAAHVIKEDKTQTESILKLKGMGIGYRDIAKIIGTSESYVALIISKNKKKSNSKEVVANGGDQEQQQNQQGAS